MQLRPYQSRSVDFLQPRQRGFIKAPAGSGKTIIAARAAALKAEPFARVVWLANTREQCEQARAAVARMEWADPVTVDVHCVAAQPDVSGADIVIIDECHHLPARTWWETVMFFDGIVWGFSATPFCGDPLRDNELRFFFGADNFLEIPREEVLGGGSITHGKVVIHDIDTAGADDDNIESLAAAETLRRHAKYPLIAVEEHHRRCLWQFTAEAVVNNFARNRMIEMIAKQTEESVLILVWKIEHGERLATHIPGSVVVHAKLSKKKRAAHIQAFRDGSLRVMIATSLADEGLDVPRASVLILAAGGRAAGKLEQRTGRVLRPHEGKQFGTIHDFADRASRMAHAQYKSRVRVYKQLGYTLQQTPAYQPPTNPGPVPI